MLISDHSLHLTNMNLIGALMQMDSIGLCVFDEW